MHVAADAATCTPPFQQRQHPALKHTAVAAFIPIITEPARACWLLSQTPAPVPPSWLQGLLWGFQLWVNLPKKDKMCKPRWVVEGVYVRPCTVMLCGLQHCM